MVAGEDLSTLLSPGLFVLLLDELGVVLEDVRQAGRRENLLPQKTRLHPGRVRRIAGSIVPPLVEGEKPGALPLEVGAEAHLVIVHGEMDHAAAELEQEFARVPVPLVL